jgi:Domain of unknown function (DUF6916)
MPVSRRRFLQNSALAAVGCAANPLFGGSGNSKTHATTGAGTNIPMTHAPGRSAFEGAVGSSFEVTSQGQSQPVSLQLLSVNDLPALVPVSTAIMAVAPPTHAKTRNTTGFVLSFSGGPAENLSQGTYTFKNSALGEFSLFIVPGGVQQYTAIFNHV